MMGGHNRLTAITSPLTDGRGAEGPEFNSERVTDEGTSYISTFANGVQTGAFK